MRYWFVIPAAVVLTALALAYAQDKATLVPPEAPVEAQVEAPAPVDNGLQTVDQRMSYLAGYQIGSNFNGLVFEVDDAALVRGVRDALQRKRPALNIDLARATMKEYPQVMAQRMQALGDANQKAGAEFLAGNANQPGVKTTASGLQYMVITEGQGDSPAPTDTVTVHYEGTLLNGDVFDSSYERNAPATFALADVIPGWREGVQLMKPGAKYKFYIPGAIAYGKSERGPGGPNSTLIFTVELIEVGVKLPAPVPPAPGD